MAPVEVGCSDAEIFELAGSPSVTGKVVVETGIDSVTVVASSVGQSGSPTEQMVIVRVEVL